jgi:hypothetical protein
MKKLVLFGALIAASLAVTGAVMAAAHPLSVDLSTTPSTISVGVPANIGGTIGGFTSSTTITVKQFAGSGCLGVAAWTQPVTVSHPVSSGSPYSVPFTAGNALAGQTISFQATAQSNGGHSAGPVCVDVKVSALASAGGSSNVVPSLPSHAFLCYSKFQGAPTTSDSWTAGMAATLLGDGYWQPYAIKGTDSSADAVNVGGYHLECNISGAQSGAGAFTDNNGESIPAGLANVVGIYPGAG